MPTNAQIEAEETKRAQDANAGIERQHAARQQAFDRLRQQALAAAPRVQLARGGKHRVGDLLRDSWGLPLISRADSYSKKARALLEFEIPDDLPDADRSAVLEFAAREVGKRMTVQARAAMGEPLAPEESAALYQQGVDRARQDIVAGKSPAAAERMIRDSGNLAEPRSPQEVARAQLGGLPPAARAAVQFGATSMRVLPGGKQPLVDVSAVPEPEGAAEHIGSFAGAATTFGAEMALLRTLPFLRPVAAPGRNFGRAAAAGALVAGAAPAEDLSSRVVHGAVTGATVGLAEYVPLKVFQRAIARSFQRLAPEAAKASRALGIAEQARAAIPGLSPADAAVATRLATAASERGGAAARAVVAGEAKAISGATRAAALAGAGASAVAFGPLASYAEYAGLKATGHDVELPSNDDMMRNMLMIGAAAIPGVARAMRGQRPTPGRIEPLDGEGARPGLPGGPSAPRTPPAPEPLFPLASAPGKRAVEAIRKQAVEKLGTERNWLFGGATAEEAFNRRFNMAVQTISSQKGVSPESLSDAELRDAAARASNEVAGMEMIRRVMTLPPIDASTPDGPRKLNTQQAATERANELMAGKSVTIEIPVASSGGKRIPVATEGTIVRVEMGPHLRQDAIRVLVEEASSGKLVPLSFDSVEHMASAMRFPAPAPASAEPVAGLTMSRPVHVPSQAPTDVGQALAAAAVSKVPRGTLDTPGALPERTASSQDVEQVWSGGRMAAEELAQPANAQALHAALASGRDLQPSRAKELIDELTQSIGIKLTRGQLVQMARRNPSPETFARTLHRTVLDRLEGRIREMGRGAPKERQAAEAPPTKPPAPPEEPPAQEVAKVEPPKPTPSTPASAAPKPKIGERVEVGEHRGAIIDTVKSPEGGERHTVLLDNGRAVSAHEGAVRPEKPKEITHYRSQSRGTDVRITEMAGAHLINAEAKQPAGPLKDALRAEIGRRNLVPKEAKSEPAAKPAAAPAPRPSEPRGAVARPDERGAGGELAPRPRAPVAGEGGDRISIARSEFTHEVDESGVPEDLRGKLTGYQRQGVAKALTAMQDQARRAFLLADGTGVGKTRQILTVAEKFRRDGRLVVIVTPNEVLGKPWEAKSLKASGGVPTVAGSYAQDAAAMGVNTTLWRPKDGPMPSSGIVLTTYTYLTDPAITDNHNAVYIFDESHALKNAGQGTRLAVKGRTLANASYATLFASATPADKPTHIEYLARIGILEGQSLSQAVYNLGFRLVDKGGRSFWVPQKNIKTEEILRRMSALFDRMTEKGSMVKREIDMHGVDVHFRRLNLSTETKGALAKIGAHFDPSNPRQKAIMLMHQRRQQEPEKARVAVELAKKELAAGRRVILFVARVNYSEVQVTTGFDRATGEKIRETIHASEGTAKMLREMLRAEGIAFAELHGAADTHAAEAMAQFQRGPAKVLVATVESGGTGINLDDTVGDAPRTLIMVTAPFNGVTNVQAAGRVWRMTSKSHPRIIYLFGDTAVDDWNAAIIAKKMHTLGATVSGQVKSLLIDPDLLDETAPEDIGSLMGGEIGGEMKEPAPPAEIPTEPPAEIPGEELVEIRGVVKKENDGKRGRVKRRVATTSSSGLGTAVEVELENGKTITVGPEEVLPVVPEASAVDQALGVQEQEPIEWQRNEYDVEENRSPEQRESIIEEESRQLRRRRETLAEVEAALAKGGTIVERGKKKGELKKFTAKQRAELEQAVEMKRRDMERSVEELERFEPGFAELVRQRADADQLELDEIKALPEATSSMLPTPENVDKYRWDNYHTDVELNGKTYDLPDAVARAKYGKFPWEMSQEEYDAWRRWATGPDEYGWHRVSIEIGHVSYYHQVQAGLVDAPIETVGSAVYGDVMRGLDVFRAAYRGEAIPESVKQDYPWVRRVLPPGKQMSDKEVEAYIEHRPRDRFGAKPRADAEADAIERKAEAARAKLRAKYGIAERFSIEHLDAVRDEWNDRRVEYQGKAYRAGHVDMGYDPATDTSFPAADLQAEYDYDDRSMRIDGVPISELKRLPEPPDWDTRDDRMERIHRQDEERGLGREVEPESEPEPTGPPLEQQTLGGLPAPKIPEGAKKVEPVAAAELPLAGEAKSFEQAFEELVRAGEDPAFASLEAARLTGLAEPEGFDAESMASRIRRQLLEEAGQQDLFGNSPILGAEGRVGVAGVPRGALEDIQARPDIVGNGKPGVWDQEVHPADIAANVAFQNRDTIATLKGDKGYREVPIAELVNNQNVNALYKAEGGFNPDLVRANPPLLWKDTAGELGPAGNLWILSGHHRVFMWRSSLPDEPMPAKVMGGSLAQAIRVANLSNRVGVGNTYSELARMAHAGLMKGEPDAKVAAELKVSGAELERLQNFFHVDADLRAVYFPPGAETAVLDTSYGAALGEQARKAPDVFTKQIQDDFLRRAVGAAGDGLSLTQFRAAMVDWKKKIADRLPPARQAELLADGGGHLSPGSWLAATERLTFDLQASAADAAATMAGIVRQYPELFGDNAKKRLTQAKVAELLKHNRAHLPRHVRAVLEDIQKKLAELTEVETEVEKRSNKLLQKIMDGTPIVDDLSAIKAFIVEKLGTPLKNALTEAAKKSGGSGAGFGSLDPAVNWLLRRAAENTHRAAQAVMRRLGKKARTVYVKDTGTGNTLAKYELTMDPTTDPASEMGIYRAGAVSGAMGSYATLPPYARGEVLRMQAARDYLPDQWEQRIYEIMGDDFIREVQQYYPADGVAFDALEKKDTVPARTLLAKYQRQFADLRTFLNELHAFVTAVSKEAGLDPPGFIDNYAPHVFEGTFAKGVDKLADFFFDRTADAEERRKLSKRFFEHREGDEHYRRSFWLALRTYVRFSGHYVAKVRFTAHMKQLLSSEWGKGDPQRAAEVRNVVLRTVWPEDDAIGRFINDSLRSSFWSKVAGGVDQITPKEAAKYLGRDIGSEEIGGEPLTRFAWAPSTVKPNFTNPAKWKKLGDTKHGIVYGGTEGHAFGPAFSELAPWIQKMLDMGLELKLRMTKNARPEDAVASMLRQRDRSTRLSRQPGNYVVSWLGRRMSVALVGLSAATALVNLTGLLTHVYTRYGALSMIRGGFRFGAGSAVSGVRSLARYLEHHNLIDPKLANAVWRSTPYMREQLLLEAGGLRQGFALSLEKMLEKIEAGQHDIDVRVAQLSTNWMAAAELFIRGWSVMAAADAAESRGHTWGNVEAWISASSKDRNRAIMDLMGQLSDPKSVISYAAESEYFTNFYYNQVGQNAMMNLPWFKTVFGLFSTFPWSSFVHKELRGLAGAGKAAAAATRNALGAKFTEKPMRGSVEGRAYDAPRMAPREPYGGRAKGDPFGPLGAWFAKGGMSYFDRQAAMEFMRGMLVSGILAAGSAYLGANLLTAYTPFAFLLLVAILRAFFPDDEELVKMFQRAEAGQAFRARHGGLVAGAPLITAIEQTRAGSDWGEVLWNATLGRMGDVMRQVFLGTLYRPARGTLEQNPEIFDTDELRWLYKAFGVKSALYDLTPHEKAMRTLGILDEERVREAREPVFAGAQ